MQRVMEDSMNTHDERQWHDLEEAMALSAAGDVAFPEMEMVAVKEEKRREEAMEVEPVAAFHPAWWASNGAGRAPRRRWPTPWGGRELVPHAAAVTEAGGVTTGGGRAGTSRRPARPRLPRTAGPPLDAAGLRGPRQRRRRRRRPLKTATASTGTGRSALAAAFFIFFFMFNYVKLDLKLGRFVAVATLTKF